MAVMLAGLPNAPSAYSPDVSPTLAKQRMKQVLACVMFCDTLDEAGAQTLFSSW